MIVKSQSSIKVYMLFCVFMWYYTLLEAFNFFLFRPLKKKYAEVVKHSKEKL